MNELSLSITHRMKDLRKMKDALWIPKKELSLFLDYWQGISCAEAILTQWNPILSQKPPVQQQKSFVSDKGINKLPREVTPRSKPSPAACPPSNALINCWKILQIRLPHRHRPSESGGRSHIQHGPAPGFPPLVRDEIWQTRYNFFTVEQLPLLLLCRLICWTQWLTGFSFCFGFNQRLILIFFQINLIKSSF